jgi:hypothetical protein
MNIRLTFLSRIFMAPITVALLFVLFAGSAEAKILLEVADAFGPAQLSDPNKISLVQTPRRAGTHAFKHAINNNGNRAEIGKLSPPGRAKAGETYWYAYSFMHMSSPAIPNGKFTILMQQFQGERNASLWPCGGGGHKISLAPNRVLQYHLQYQSGGGIKCNRIDMASWDDIKDKWVDVVVNVKWVSSGAGFLKLWLRIGGDAGKWEQKINYTGATMASGEAPYTKIGPYLGGGSGNGSRLIYTDEYRFADGSSVFEDVAPGSKSGQPPTQPPAGGSADIKLSAGWNLISFPLNPAEKSPAQVLAGIDGKYSAVYSFNTGNNQYRSYVPGSTSNDLTSLDAGQGYWIYMDQAATLTVRGTPAPKAVQLAAGWNLVGYNSTSSAPVATALSSVQGKFEAVYGFDAASGQYKGYTPPDAADLSSLTPGEGYWIYATEKVTWTLP